MLTCRFLRSSALFRFLQEVAGSIRVLIEAIFSGDALLSTGPFAAKWRDDLFVACRALLLTTPTQLAGTVFAPARAAHMPHLWAALAAMASVGKIVSAAATAKPAATTTAAASADAGTVPMRLFLCSFKCL
jgi:hypothetical protein